MISRSFVSNWTAHACDYYEVTVDLDINKYASSQESYMPLPSEGHICIERGNRNSMTGKQK